MEVRGSPVPVLEDLTLLFGIIPNAAFSAAGTLVMQTGGGGVAQLGLHELVWIDRSGGTTQVDSTWTFRHSLSNNNAGWALSPDGRRLAIGLYTSSGDDIWIKELPMGPLSRLTFDSTFEERPRWSPDGKFVTYIVDGAFRSASAARMAPAGRRRSSRPRRPSSRGSGPGWTVAGGAYRWRQRVASASGNIIALRPGVDSAPTELLATSGFDESAPALISGREVAGVRLGRDRPHGGVYPPLPERGRREVAGLLQRRAGPLWAHSGRELFYVDGERNMMVAPMPTGPSQLGARVRLFKLRDDIYLTAQEWYTPFDISPDDRRFLMSRQVTTVPNPGVQFVLVENWFEELKEKVKK